MFPTIQKPVSATISEQAPTARIENAQLIMDFRQDGADNDIRSGYQPDKPFQIPFVCFYKIQPVPFSHPSKLPGQRPVLKPFQPVMRLPFPLPDILKDRLDLELQVRQNPFLQDPYQPGCP